MMTSPQSWAVAAVVVLYLYLDGKELAIDIISLLCALAIVLWVAVVTITIVPAALTGTLLISPLARILGADTRRWGSNVIRFITRWMFFGVHK